MTGVYLGIVLGALGTAAGIVALVIAVQAHERATIALERIEQDRQEQ